jgi:hypothetical protein
MIDQQTNLLDAGTAGTAGAPVLIFVHGTGAAPDVEDEAEAPSLEPSRIELPAKPKWYQEGSQFESWLRERVTLRPAVAPDDGDCIRFIWSGLNSESARNEAASDLAALILKLAGDGRSIHFLAHSHGGNVVRRAIELTARGSAPPAASIRSVTTFGTPFFHYSLAARIIRAIIAATVLAVVTGLIAWLYVTTNAAESDDIQTLGFFGLLMLGGVLLYSLGSLFFTIFRLAPLSGDAAPSVAADIDFCNLFTARDEAIGLLMSFNRSIVLMQRADFIQVWMNGPLGCGLGLTVLVMLVAGTARIWEALGGNFDYLFDDLWSFVLTVLFMIISLVVGIVVSALVFTIFGLILTLPVRLGAAVMDNMVTARLRTMAFGADAGNGMVAVQTFPWAGTEHMARQIPPEIEEEIEAHISAKSTELWARLRAGLVAGVPLLGQDMPRIAQEALTWDELSHTVYYQVEAFADLIAQRLIGTGDWQKRPQGKPPEWDKQTNV